MSQLLAAGACLAVGLPIVLLLLPRRTSFWWVGSVGLVVGLATWMFFGLAAMQLGHFAALPLAAVGVGVSGVLGGLCLRLGRWPERVLSVSELVPLAVIGAIAVWLRRKPVEFVFEIGDMGEYVNWAHRVAQGDVIAGSFPHGFPVVLALFNLVPGAPFPEYLVPLIGLMTWLLAVSLAIELEVSGAARLTVAAIVAIHPLTVWFAVLPVSESLFAVFLLACLVLLARTLRTGEVGSAALAGVLLGGTVFIRGDGLLLALPAAAYVLWTAREMPKGRHAAAGAWFAILAVSVAYAGWVYDLRFVETYMVRQLGHLLGDSLTSRLMELWTASSLLASLALPPLALGLLWGVRAIVVRYAPEQGSLPIQREPFVVVLCLGLGAMLVIPKAGLLDALIRLEALSLALIAAGTWGVLVQISPARRRGIAFTAWIALIIACLIYAIRVPAARNHDFYLYWDRYLFAMGFPAWLVLLVLGADDVYGFMKKRLSSMGVAVAAVLMTAGLLQLAMRGRPLRGPMMFEGAYEDLGELDRLLGDDGTPVLYSGFARRPAHWGFPNTVRAYALPLRQVWHQPFVNLHGSPFRPDPVLGPRRVGHSMNSRGLDRVKVLVASRFGVRCPTPTGFTSEHLGRRRIQVPWMKRHIDRSGERMRVARFTMDVCYVERPGPRLSYDMGGEGARSLLSGTWGSDEAEVDGRSFVWTVGDDATLTVVLPVEHFRVGLRLKTSIQGVREGQSLAIGLDGVDLGSVDVSADWEDVYVDLPAEIVREGGMPLVLEPSWRRTPPPPGTGGDTRSLGVAVDRVWFEPVSMFSTPE